MKIAKVMLLSVAIFSIGGGLLASKAKRFGKLCAGTANGANTLVPIFAGAHMSSVFGTPVLLYRTTKDDGAPITAASDCINLTTTTQNSTTIVEE
ncbi:MULTISPECIES: hypothetical protein [Niastella]|uniref:Uncharacterized protein n=1 Tax=Niastella soli TaxID=2821487 RepID=A0ABS3YZU3_9BACT|nr:hypothetical protein [Niastella soli]MBO9203278.1 hypothetical protein [Niastella soli]